MLSQRRSGTSAFYHPTYLGTIENLTDASGSVTDSYAFTAFGVPVAASGATTNPHRYVGALGYCTDPATGLTYVRARYLRPATGSWMSVDPVASEPRYQYVGGRATWAVDASGPIPRPECLRRVLASRKQYGKYVSDAGDWALRCWDGCRSGLAFTVACGAVDVGAGAAGLRKPKASNACWAVAGGATAIGIVSGGTTLICMRSCDGYHAKLLEGCSDAYLRSVLHARMC